MTRRLHRSPSNLPKPRRPTFHSSPLSAVTHTVQVGVLRRRDSDRALVVVASSRRIAGVARRALLTGWRDFWGLFGRRKTRRSIATAKPIRHKTFLDFTDPFAAGVAGKYSPEELVRYTFEAFEAWARDNGFPRGADQTAHEFARQVASRAEHLAMPARKLAELYSIAAYAPGTLPPSSAEHLRAFWQALRSESLVA